MNWKNFLLVGLLCTGILYTEQPCFAAELDTTHARQVTAQAAKIAAHDQTWQEFRSNTLRHWNQTPLAEQSQATNTSRLTDEIILVIDHRLSHWSRQADGTWQINYCTYAGYGKNGLSAERVEGDKTTPIGSFPLLTAFGKAENPGTQMGYQVVTPHSYWTDADNAWVESKTRLEGEHLNDYYQYKYAMAIGFNLNPMVSGKGGAIFLHCKSKDRWYTAGCVSVTESSMVRLLRLTHDGAYIIIVPDEHSLINY